MKEFTDIHTAFRMQEKGQALFGPLGICLDEDVDFWWAGRIDNWSNKEREDMLASNRYTFLTIDELANAIGEKANLINMDMVTDETFVAFYITDTIALYTHFALPCFEKGTIPARFEVEKPTFISLLRTREESPARTPYP